MAKEALERMPKSWLILREIFLKGKSSDESPQRADPNEKDRFWG